MANHALDLNPPNAALHISTHGSDWLWAAFSIMTFSLLFTIVLDFMVGFDDRRFLGSVRLTDFAYSGPAAPDSSTNSL